MPWSPIPKFPTIIKNLKQRGYVSEVTYNIMRVEVMRTTGLIRDDSIKRAIIAMEELGYIESIGDWTYRIIYGRDQKAHKEEELAADAILDKHTAQEVEK